MANEKLSSPEILRSVRGIRIATKTMASGCPLAEMINRSGIGNMLPQLSLQIDPTLGQDYQNVVNGGDWKDIDVLSFYAPRDSFGVAVSSPANTVYFGLYTLMTDGSRKTPLLIGLKGVSIKDRDLLWQTTMKLFPNLKFMVSNRDINFREQHQLGEQNIVPLAEFDLSQKLPRITSEKSVKTPVPPITPEDFKLNQDQKDQISVHIKRYEDAMFGSEKFAILTELSKLIPGFIGIRQGTNSEVINSDGVGRT